MKITAPHDWVAVTDGNETEELENLLSNCILNPGCVYYREGKYVLFNVQARSIRSLVRWPQLLPADIRKAYPEDKRIEITEELWEKLVTYREEIGVKDDSRIKLI